ncbi:hypothetical protein DEI83_08905 [Curtobacterium sp. MCBD17_021]|nr:hypothetical protein DEI83_08905 [Curtobacterium sp. MCBD17_021]
MNRSAFRSARQHAITPSTCVAAMSVLFARGLAQSPDSLCDLSELGGEFARVLLRDGGVRPERLREIAREVRATEQDQGSS